ncbi:MAG: hypothetical protein ACRKGH_09645 [Dehalogenimonas sp.]
MYLESMLEEKKQKRTRRIPIRTIGTAMAELLRLKDDINLILAHYERSPSALAEALNVHRKTIWTWKTGHAYPREPVHVLAIMKCAEEIRSKQKSTAAS